MGFKSAWAEPGVADSTALLGHSCALSGPFRVLGTEYRDGAVLWFDEVNRQGGVAGRQIKLLSLDDGYNTAQAIANTKRLVEDEKVFAISGQFGTGITLACLPFTTAKE